ncbi:MAG: hypothetical protein IPN06_12950 [Burkholderiales bacterium]|nr:hypothetical protein [Burkholderiales bacterium]
MSFDYSIVNLPYVEILRVIGSNGVTITGNAEDNFLTGNIGNDVLTGGAGADAFGFRQTKG